MTEIVPGEIEFTGNETPPERAAKVFCGVIDAMACGRFPPDSPSFKSLGEIEPQTQLYNRILLARAHQDIIDPKGRIYVYPIEPNGEDPFAMMGESKLEVRDAEGEITKTGQVAAIFLNPGVLPKSEIKKGRVKLKNEEQIKQIVDATIQAQVYLESCDRKEVSVLTRTEILTATGG